MHKEPSLCPEALRFSQNLKLKPIFGIFNLRTTLERAEMA